MLAERARWRCSSIARSKPVAIHAGPALRGDLLGELDGKAVRVVQHERVRAADSLASAEQFLESYDAGLEGLREGGFLLRQHALDRALLLGQLGVVRAEFGDQPVRAAREERLANMQASRANARA